MQYVVQLLPNFLKLLDAARNGAEHHKRAAVRFYGLCDLAQNEVYRFRSDVGCVATVLIVPDVLVADTSFARPRGQLGFPAVLEPENAEPASVIPA